MKHAQPINDFLLYFTVFLRAWSSPQTKALAPDRISASLSSLTKEKL